MSGDSFTSSSYVEKQLLSDKCICRSNSLMLCAYETKVHKG